MSHTRLVIAIESADRYEERRTLCRQGWLKLFLKTHPGVDAFFVVGHGGSGPYRDGDIVYVPSSDTYEGLAEKTQQVIRYILGTYDCAYLFKCDDDTFVHLDRLVARLNEDDYVGRMNTLHGDRGGVYAEGGAGYILSKRAAKLAVDNFIAPESVNWAEDVCVALALRNAGILPVHDDRFSQQPTPIPDRINDQITCHYIREQRQVNEILDALQCHNR